MHPRVSSKTLRWPRGAAPPAILICTVPRKRFHAHLRPRYRTRTAHVAALRVLQKALRLAAAFREGYVVHMWYYGGWPRVCYLEERPPLPFCLCLAPPSYFRSLPPPCPTLTCPSLPSPGTCSYLIYQRADLREACGAWHDPSSICLVAGRQSISTALVKSRFVLCLHMLRMLWYIFVYALSRDYVFMIPCRYIIEDISSQRERDR